MKKKTASNSPSAASSKPDPQQEAQERARACSMEIKKVLEKHNCDIVAYLLPLEPVGPKGSKALIETTYGVVANPTKS